MTEDRMRAEQWEANRRRWLKYSVAKHPTRMDREHDRILRLKNQTRKWEEF